MQRTVPLDAPCVTEDLFVVNFLHSHETIHFSSGYHMSWVAEFFHVKKR